MSYASWIQRVGAYLLDSLAFVPYLAGLLVMTVTSVPGYDNQGRPIDEPTPTGLLTFAVTAVISLALWVWNRWVRGGRTGQSWGKKAVGITLQRDLTGEPLGVWMAFVREIAHYVDGFLYLGYLWPLWDSKRQTFSDKLTKSVVVR
ncbi:RDD family protein [uncultured Cellulomonas sp.]|uniref:RDD family protein n=1 Tax=uncultured Cellulomonas sp. TaxID=189682 RepID=UPI0037DC0130